MLDEGEKIGGAMALPNEEALRLKQEAMRNRKQKEREEREAALANRPLCAACNRRVARLGQPYCSRCTTKGVVNQLRDTLPGMPVETSKVTITDHTTLRQIGIAVDNSPIYTSDPIPPPPPGPPPQATLSEPANGQKFYTRTQVADMLGVSNMTLIRWERKGKIPPSQKIVHSNKCVYTQEMVDLAMQYKNQTYTPHMASISTTPGTPAALVRTTKISKNFGKKLEKSVASRMGSFGRLLR